jgi:hypothetical protein
MQNVLCSLGDDSDGGSADSGRALASFDHHLETIELILDLLEQSSPAKGTGKGQGQRQGQGQGQEEWLHPQPQQQ